MRLARRCTFANFRMPQVPHPPRPWRHPRLSSHLDGDTRMDYARHHGECLRAWLQINRLRRAAARLLLRATADSRHVLPWGSGAAGRLNLAPAAQVSILSRFHPVQIACKRQCETLPVFWHLLH